MEVIWLLAIDDRRLVIELHNHKSTIENQQSKDHQSLINAHLLPKGVVVCRMKVVRTASVLKHLFNSLHGLLNIFKTVKGADSAKVLAAFSESCSWRADDACLFKQ